MKYFQDSAGTVHGIDDTDPSQAADLAAAIPDGWTDITASWPPAPPNPLIALAVAALAASDRVAIRCIKKDVSFATWLSYDEALVAIINGTDTTSTTLPTKPAYPAGS
jgi:hypothetical protein